MPRPRRKLMAPAAPAKFPNRIRFYREARGWALRQLADAIHVSISTAQRLETGETQLREDRLNSLARAFNVALPDLLGAVDQKQHEQEAELVRIFRSLNPEQREHVLRLTRTFLATEAQNKAAG